MIRLSVCVWSVVLMCASSWCKAENADSSGISTLSGVLRTEQERKNISVDFSKADDTIWIVNYFYSVKVDTFDVSITIPKEKPEEKYDFVRVNWGIIDGNSVYSKVINLSSLEKDTILPYDYPEGRYFLTVEYHESQPISSGEGGQNIRYCIFNQLLKGDIEKIGEEDGCLEWGIDTFYFKMKGHEDNPQGTKYQLKVSAGDAPGGDFWKIDQEQGPQKDSALVVFKEASGSFPISIYFEITYQDEDEDSPNNIARKETDSKKINIYEKPDLRKIFHFKDSLADSGDIGIFKEIHGCTNQFFNALTYDSLMNEKYKYHKSPAYSSRYNFEVNYFRKDSIKDPNWKDVTSNTDMIDEKDMRFKYPGFYKIGMIASNACGADTLNTDSIRGKKWADVERHIIIHQSGVGAIRCDSSLICGDIPEEGKEITFIDAGDFFKWDDIPIYNFYIIHTTETDCDTLSHYKISEILHYNKGHELTNMNELGFDCDSTVLKIRLKEPGVYDISLSRSSHCDVYSVHERVVIGDKPELPSDSLWRYLGGEGDDITQAINKCGAYIFKLPKLDIDSNYLALDSILWTFKKGSKKDTTLQDFPYVDPVFVYKLDSLDQENFIVLEAKNSCGWSERLEIKLNTYTKPNVKFWRGDKEDNNELCVGIPYEYHWKGDMPKKYIIRGKWTEKVKLNDIDHDANVFGCLATHSGNDWAPEVGIVEFFNGYESITESFEIENAENDRCIQKIDGQIVSIIDSRIEIIGIDTVQEWDPNVYHFTSKHVQIDTGHLKGGITWTNMNLDGGIFTDENSFTGDYTLSDSDKVLDTLLFELSGLSKCEEVLKDTLIVIVPHPILNAGIDTICEGAEYELWGAEYPKTSGKFINTDKLSWEILDNTAGKLGELTESGKGNKVEYIPSESAYEEDTVKIEVKAWHIYNEGPDADKIDTVFLKVNAAPQHIFPDTLYLKAGEEEGARVIFLKEIKEYKDGLDVTNANCDSISWSFLGGDGEGAVERDGKVTIGTPPSTGNYKTVLQVSYAAYKGCSDSIKDVDFIGIVPPIVVLEDIMICANDGDCIILKDSIMGRDKFTEYKWDITTGNGILTDNEYCFGNEDPSSIKLGVEKTFDLYTGEKDFIYFGSKTIELKRVGKPEFSLKKDETFEEDFVRDTLCVSETIFKYSNEWIKGNFDEANYTKDNFVTSNIGLIGVFPNFTLKDGVEEAKLIVSVDLGYCPTWKNIEDTLHIVRNKKMTGDFNVHEICEGEELAIKIIEIDEDNQGYYWEATNGTIGGTNQEPIFIPNSIESTEIATIVLRINPPYEGCVADSIKKSFWVKKKPTFSLPTKEAVMCEDGKLVIETGSSDAEIDSIIWEANGQKIDTTKDETFIEYQYNATHVNDANEIEIIAYVTPKGPCSDVIKDTITITVNSKITINAKKVSICQGSSIQLNDSIKFDHDTEVTWSLGSAEGELNGTIYTPGEISGENRLSVTVEGLPQCKSETYDVVVDVNASIKPIFSGPNAGCENKELEYRTEISSQSPNSLEWYVNGNPTGKKEDVFKYTFKEDGSVGLETSLNGKCRRLEDSVIIIYDAPDVEIIMTPDSIVGKLKAVKFEGSENSDITTYNWTFPRGEFVSSDSNDRIQIYKFDIEEDNNPFRSTTLTVTGQKGCITSKVKGMKIIDKPIVNIVENFNKCTGEITFNESATGEILTYFWDFGDGKTSQEEAPTHKYTPTYEDKKYRIVLTVSNAAGKDSDTLDVTVISKLDTDFTLASITEYCDSKKGFRNATKGDVDSYKFTWGDGTKDTTFTSYLGTIYHQYNNSEIEEKKFEVSLIAINQCYTDTIEEYIGVKPNNFDALLKYNSSSICFGDEVVFENVSRGFGENAQAYWYFEGGIESINDNSNAVSYQFNTPLRHQVVLVMIGDCGSDSDTVFVEVKGDTSLNFEIEEKYYCSGQGVNFKVSPDIIGKFTDFEWDFGGENIEKGTVVTKIFNEGNYTVSLTAKSIGGGACPTTTPLKLFTVKKSPIADINLADLADTSGCLPHTVSKLYCDNTQKAVIEWVFGNGDIKTNEDTVRNVLYENAEKYVVRLTAKQNDCVSIDSLEVNALSTPDTHFELLDSIFCANSNVINVINKTPDASSSEFKWYYIHEGDTLNSSSEAHPQGLDLDQLGRVKIELVATNMNTSCPSHYIDSVMLGEPIELKLWGDTVVCGKEFEEGFEVILDYTTSFSDFATMYCLWDDGSVDTIRRPEHSGKIPHSYDEKSAYNVQVVIENKYKCLDTAYHKLNLYNYPASLEFEISDGPYCTGQDVSMHIDPEIKNDYTDFEWYFGTQLIVKDQDFASILCSIKGEREIILKAKSTLLGNCPAEERETIVVYQMPDVYIKPQSATNLSGCTPLVVKEFTRGGNINEGIIYWDFKNEQESDDTVVTNMSFEKAGKYNVQLSITSSQGCVGRDSILVIAKETPDAKFSFPSASIVSCFGGKVDIKLTNDTDYPNLSTFEWLYATKFENSISEDNIFYSGPVPNENFKTEHLGEIQLKLIAINKETACPDTSVQTIVSGHPLKLVADIDTALCDGEVLEVEYSTLKSEATSIVSNMGDEARDTRDTFSHVYDAPREYDFKALAKNEYGCKDSILRKITVYPLPIADFDVADEDVDFGELNLPEGFDFDKLPDVESGLRKFTNYSDVDEYDFARETLYSTWNFGDSTVSDLSELTHHFSNNGRYEVELLVKTDHGCADSTAQYVYIDAIKGLFIPNAFAPSAGGDNPGISLFQPKGIGLLSYKIQVYDADSGTCVWSSDKLLDGKPAEAWDGTFNGQPQPKKSYVWKASAIFIDGTVWEGKNGKLLLIR